MENIALVAGATGIVGSNLAAFLVANGWATYGLSRTPNNEIKSVIPVAADLTSRERLSDALANIRPTHVFFTSWMRKESEAENIRVNAALVRNLLDVLSPKKSIRHVALVTGLKHYLGPFEAYTKAGFALETPVHEGMPRLPLQNFYYAQEDEVYAAADRDGFSWSVHRPHTIVGKAVGNLMNIGMTLAVYASICKELGRPFRWPGSKAQWEGLSDITDARILAAQLLWAATTDAAKNEAFNIVNGDVFRWNKLWYQIADWFDVAAIGFEETIHPLEQEMKGLESTWQAMAAKYGLVEANLNRLISPWHTDLDLGRPVEVVTDMSKSRELGFTAYQRTTASFTDLFSDLKAQRLIP
ncbi:SDR family oxidoreductase [Chitinophaga pendula]|uniref:SDR family oxidoreductase n=1 Tax=Chitinophaga TaxID=79328 RepID=UPI000BAEFBDB|nr:MULTISPECIES: SDR family oxidoreductase [Chitinophaga]ASZ13883.1 NAD-dependent dehydratase [Chitinophaga sp. MD30]UCJ08497.1 SDR family oxidoreductase [Chitinophaga pendula]